MRIAILTQPLRYNYGGILQNFALQTVLKRMGHDVVTLDPHRYNYKWWQYPVYTFHVTWDVFLNWFLKGQPLTKRNFILYPLQFLLCHTLFRNKKWDLNHKKKLDRECKLLGTNTFRFVDQHIKRREYWDLSRDVKEGDYDAFVVGSDQVWRPEYNADIRNMFLDFTKGWDVKRIAYAASYGVDTWVESEEITGCCRDYLKQFNFISVREDSGVTLCKEVFNVEASHVLDPTLLLSKEDYISLLKLDKVPKSKGNLLVYILDYTDDKNLLIQRVSNERHLVPFRVNSDVENYQLRDVDRRIQPPLEQWLRGFYDAEYIITDSFHACVFSLLFGKPFIVYANKNRGITRFSSLLHQFSLEDCMISSSDEYNGFTIYPKGCLTKLDNLRKESLDALCLGLK